MYTNVSDEFLLVHGRTGRTFRAKIELSSGTVLPGTDCEIFSLKFVRGNSSADDITFGDVSSAVVDAELSYNGNVFASLKDGMSAVFSISLQLRSSVEHVPMGEFRIVSFKRNGDKMSVSIADRLYDSDTAFLCTSALPAKANAVVSEICNDLGITGYEADGIDLSEMEITAIPENVTKRQMLSYIASYFGRNAYMGRNGKLVFGWYDFDSPVTVTDDEIEVPTLGDEVSITAVACAVDSETVLTSGTGRAMTFENPYMTQSRLDSLRRDIAYVPCDMNQLVGSVLIDNDVIRYGDCVFPVMSSELHFDGGVSLTVKAVGKTEEEAAKKTVSPTDIVLNEAKKYASDAIKHITNTMNGVNGGYRIEKYDADGTPFATYWMDAPDELSATHCIVINKDGIGFGSKESGAEEWDFTQGWLIDGNFSADYLNAHHLSITGNITDTQDGTAINETVQNHFKISADLEIPALEEDTKVNAAGLETWGKLGDSKSKAFYTNWGAFFDNTDANASINALLVSIFAALGGNNFYGNGGFRIASTDADGKTHEIMGTPDGGFRSTQGFYDNGIRCLTEETGLMFEKAPVYNVKDYGMDNTGTRSVVSVFNEILQKCKNNGGGTVFFPNGTYYFDDNVNIPSDVRIQGDVCTVFTTESQDGKFLRASTFLRMGDEDGEKSGYTAFANIEINGIIFDLGGQWSLSGNSLTYKAKYKNGYYYSYCPVVACHGDGLKVINCTFRNGIYAGYTGSSSSATTSFTATNPHIMDIVGVRNILIDGCVFEPVLTSCTALTNWSGKATGETAEADVNYSDMIQLDAAYGGGGDGSLIHLPSDSTNCRDVIIKNCRFIGLPEFDWMAVVNNTGDDESVMFRTEFPLADSSGKDTNTMIKANLTAFRFSPVAAIGGCHEVGTTASLDYQPENVEIFNNIFEGTWSSHYGGINAQVQIRWKNYSDDYKDSEGYYYPLYNGSPEIHLARKEPARHGCHGAVYALPGAKGFNIHNNVFKESKAFDENKSTAVFLYGSLAGIVHDNVFINYGEPLPVGKKSLAMNYAFDSDDLWQKSSTGYYDGIRYCKSSNNIWIKDDVLSTELNRPGIPSEYNVLSYGATGDGETDDGFAIQSALDACNEAGGGTVYFPLGTYCISKTVFFYSNQKLYFEPGTVLRRIENAADGDDTSGCFLCNWFEVSDTVYGNIACKNVEINGALFDMDETIEIKVAPINTCHASDIRIVNCRFINNFAAHCIEINSSDNVFIEKCIFSDYADTIGSPQYNEMIQIDKAVNGALGKNYDGQGFNSLRGYKAETYISEVSSDSRGCSNINISNCVFETNEHCVAIGNHHELAVNDTKNTDINIHDNIFTGGANSRGYLAFDKHTFDVNVYVNHFYGGVCGVTATADNANFLVYSNRFDDCESAYSGSITAYCNLIDGVLDASSDEAFSIIAMKDNSGTVTADISSFIDDAGSNAMGSYTELNQYYIYKAGNRIKGYIEFSGVKTSSTGLFRPFAVKEAYRHGVTCNTFFIGDIYHSSMWKPIIGYMPANGLFTATTGVNASSSAISQLRLNFDYFITP